MTPRTLGYLKDPHSDDDVRLGVSRSVLLVSSADLPEADLHLVEHAPPVKDQDIFEFCVGFAIMNMGYIMQSVAGMDAVLPSPGFICWNSLKSHGDEGRNQGTYMRNAFVTLRDLGISPEEYCRIADLDKRLAYEDYDGRPDHIAYTHAYDARFEVDYIRLDGSGDELKRQVKSCIVQGIPVGMGTLVSKAFTQLKHHELVDIPEGDPIAGGHAMCIVGYDWQGVIIRNSWGLEWGNGGDGHLSWRYFTENWVDDVWALRRMPQIG